jgi:hypothetical protein
MSVDGEVPRESEIELAGGRHGLVMGLEREAKDSFRMHVVLVEG